MKKYNKIYIFLFILLLPNFVHGINTLVEGFQISGNQVTVDAHGTCKKLGSVSGTSYFVPTKTSGEWSLFRSNKPSDINMTDCVVPEVSCPCVTNSSQICTSGFYQDPTSPMCTTFSCTSHTQTVSSCNASNVYQTSAWPGSAPNPSLIGEPGSPSYGIQTIGAGQAIPISTTVQASIFNSANLPNNTGAGVNTGITCITGNTTGTLRIQSRLVNFFGGHNSGAARQRITTTCS